MATKQRYSVEDYDAAYEAGMAIGRIQGSRERARRAPIGPVEILLLLLTIVMVGIIGATYFGIDPRPLPQLAPATAVIAPQRPANRPASAPAPAALPAATPIPGICQDQACADAAYQAAVEAAEQPAVVHPDNVIVPVVIQERTFERTPPPPPGEAPMAEPVAGPVDIQGTHQCRHGQVWTDAGCKNPPSDKGSKTR